MPRGPRPVAPSIPHHVIHRGNNRQTIHLLRASAAYLIRPESSLWV